MQWILQEYEDTNKLASVLDRFGIHYTFHKVVPFIGELSPEPVILDPEKVVFFGSYSLWRYAESRNLKPGVFKIKPYVLETAWKKHSINAQSASFFTIKDLSFLNLEDRDWFIRPVEDSKEISGRVMTSQEISDIAHKVVSLKEEELIGGSLRPDTLMMLCDPVRIVKEWRLWVINGKIVTYSLYKEGYRVVYREEIDDDALWYASSVIEMNRDYSKAYVLDICRLQDGSLHILETNCMNAAGFYAADLNKLVMAIEDLK